MDLQEGLVVDSVTGVDVALPIAGPGARAFAFIIDWHLRTILSVAWYIVAAKDRMIQPDVERAMAKKINATTTTLPTSHVPMLSRPRDVAAVIVAAAQKTDVVAAGK